MGARSLTLYLPLSILVLAYFLYRLHQRRREYEVLISIIHAILLPYLTPNVQADMVFGNQHGCQPMTAQFPVKWPLGIDVLRSQLIAIADDRLFAYRT